MSALDYHSVIQPSGTLRLSSHDDFVPFQLKPYKPNKEGTVGGGARWWWNGLASVIGGPNRAGATVTSTADIAFPVVHSGAVDPLHPGHAVPVLVDVPGIAPISNPLPAPLPVVPAPVQAPALPPISTIITQPTIAPVIETNQNGATEPKLPSQTYIHLVPPSSGSSVVALPVVIPHDGHEPGLLERQFHIQTLVPLIYDALKSTVGYVIWTYEDLYNQLSHWDGKATSLLKDVHFLWRAAVTGLVTLALIEIGPLLQSLFSLWWDLMELLFGFFRFIGSAVQEAVYMVRILYDDVDALWFRITGR
jgi:hypothetical protein